MVRVGIIGATGYTGIELVRILSAHPQVEISVASSHSYAGAWLSEIYPHLLPEQDIKLVDDNPEHFVDVDQIFLALPHGLSGTFVERLLPLGKKVIDLGADFRLTSPATYEKWYGHKAPADLEKAVYGLPELKREQIKGSELIANPGCYCTASIIGLGPALKAGMLEPDSIIIDAKSGVSGAGRTLALGSHYSEVNENLKAYSVGTHRHTPEIEQELSLLAGENLTVSFTPHLVPMTRGILATTYGKLRPGWDEAGVRHYYEEFYAGERFIRLLPQGVMPQTKWVYGTNHCLINLVLDHRTGRLVILTVLDNLIKGAAGQAVQNLNLLWGLPEDMGLNTTPFVP